MGDNLEVYMMPSTKGFLTVMARKFYGNLWWTTNVLYPAHKCSLWIICMYIYTVYIYILYIHIYLINKKNFSAQHVWLHFLDEKQSFFSKFPWDNCLMKKSPPENSVVIVWWWDNVMFSLVNPVYHVCFTSTFNTNKVILFFEQPKLVGGFNPFEKYSSKWKSSPNRESLWWVYKPPTWRIIPGRN